MVDALGIQRFVLAGNSLGGQIAWATAAALPDRVAGLILVDASGYGVDPMNAPLGFVLAGTPVVRDLMRYTLPRGLVESRSAASMATRKRSRRSWWTCTST